MCIVARELKKLLLIAEL